jgi:capsular polysaccharide biosynthesis protein
VILLVLHGFQDEFEQFLIDILDYAVELSYIGVCISQHNLNDLGELLLEDLLNEFPGGALGDGLRGFSFIG